MACFPWSISSLESLSRGDWNDARNAEQWSKVVRKWRGAVAVGGVGKVRLFMTRKDKPFSTIATIATSNVSLCNCNAHEFIIHVKWPYRSQKSK